MAKRKVTAANWPTQHLVLWRTTLDDVPMLLTPDRKVADRYVKTLAVKPESGHNDLDNRDAIAAHKVMGLDICSPINLSIVSFRHGRPYRLKVVREMFHTGPEREPPTPAQLKAFHKRVNEQVERITASKKPKHKKGSK